MEKSFEQFKKGFEKFLQTSTRLQEVLNSAAASELVVTNTHLQGFIQVDGKRRQLSEINYEHRLRISRPFNSQLFLQYAILSWYLPPISRFELQESLRNYCTHDLNYWDYQIYLESQDLMMAAIFRETHVTHRTLFGNILTGYYFQKVTENGKTRTIKSKVRIKLTIEVPSRTRPKVYRRGYNDHGSSAPEDKKILRRELETEGNKIQSEIELERLNRAISYHHLKLSLERFIFGSG